ncbi:MAG TPA: HAMP domain-containing sensor histidine kinase [Actinomycetota bacterium]
MRRSFAARLAAAFAGVGILAAAITALLVNMAFGGRFDAYLTDQREARERAIVAGLADSYRRMESWDTGDLDTLAPLAIMDGGTLALESPAGDVIWTARATGSMAAMHRSMMGTGALGPERRLPVIVRGDRMGVAVVRLPQAGVLPSDLAFRASINRLLLYGGAAAAAVALALGIILARRATAPARALTRAARSLAEGDRSRRIASGARDEFGEMAAAFDQMAEALEEQDRLRRSFAADVAHELRTPLSILRSEVEALQDGVRSAGPETFGSLHEEVLRLSRLVADLETMAAADAAGFSLKRERVDLGAVARSVVSEMAGAFESAGVGIRVEAGDVEVDADPVRVRQMLGNLLSNAMKFTPVGGEVRVEVSAQDGCAVLRVADTGPGIPAEEIPRVFDRFFRGAGVRAGGSGVGLAVVRELARAHGGEVEVASRPGEGTAFTIRLPQTAPGLRHVFTTPSHPPTTVPVKGA